MSPEPSGPRPGATFSAPSSTNGSRDIGRVKVQIIEEAARTAFGQEHSLCIFRPVCGDIPVLDTNGDLYSCDHYVDRPIGWASAPGTSLTDLPSAHPSGPSDGPSETFTAACRECAVLPMCNGECPRNRFVPRPTAGRT